MIIVFYFILGSSSPMSANHKFSPTNHHHHHHHFYNNPYGYPQRLSSPISIYSSPSVSVSHSRSNFRRPSFSPGSALLNQNSVSVPPPPPPPPPSSPLFRLGCSSIPYPPIPMTFHRQPGPSSPPTSFYPNPSLHRSTSRHPSSLNGLTNGDFQMIDSPSHCDMGWLGLPGRPVLCLVECLLDAAAIVIEASSHDMYQSPGCSDHMKVSTRIVSLWGQMENASFYVYLAIKASGIICIFICPIEMKIRFFI